MRSLRILRRRRFSASEHGQALILFVGGLATLIALVGLSVDAGRLVLTRTDLQKAADAAVFAAAQELPNDDAAASVASTYVQENSPGAIADIVFAATYAQNDTITVTATRTVEYAFLKVLGMDSATVSAHATARVGTFVGGAGLMPWGLVACDEDDDPGCDLAQNNCFEGIDDDTGMPIFSQNVDCTLKFGAGSNSGGDFGALALDGTGANTYRDSIKNGTTNAFKKGDKVVPETGNMSGPTKQGINDRLSQPVPASCSGTPVKTNSDGTTSIKTGCENHPLIVVIPVVDQIQNPELSEILGFAFMYLDPNSPGNGNQSAVKGQFLEFVTELPEALYEGFGDGARAVMLIE